MWPLEDSYGLTKRVKFVCQEIECRSPSRVLDYGCGTGANLTMPLARRFPQIRFLGVDNDPASIAHARGGSSLSNLEFRVFPFEFHREAGFDLIIASEVLEHVDDPAGFLDNLRALLADGGVIVFTVPNGYGPFEIASLAEALFQMSGVYEVLRRVKRVLTKAPPDPRAQVDTLALSPHVNFFSYGELRGLFDSRGLGLLRYRARTFLCGFGFDQLLCNQGLLDWNARIADHLPPHLVSDWMFVLQPADPGGARDYRRSVYARFRRRLNLRRLGQSAPAKPA